MKSKIEKYKKLVEERKRCNICKELGLINLSILFLIEDDENVLNFDSNQERNLVSVIEFQGTEKT